MLLWCLLLGTAGVVEAEVVELRRQGDGFVLLRGGEHYFIRGAGGWERLEELAAAGGNSLRTWSAEGAGPLLDRAHALGLTVTVGLWVGHERHGFDYGDEEAVAAQLEKFRRTVVALKDHPALLMWSIGNEVHLSYKDRRVWDAIDAIAAMIRQVDGQHPTMTVLAGANVEAVGQVVERCPHIDILGVNSYAGLPGLPRQLPAAGWDGPYVVAEWGTSGFWEVAKTAWGAPLEPTSSQKAELFLTRYKAGVLEAPDRCLGSYAFLWGHKQERTPTWFGLFLETGEATPMVGTLQYAWTGNWPDRRAPEIGAIRVEGAEEGGYIKSGQRYRASVRAADPERDALSYRWELWRESTAVSQGGDREERPEDLSALLDTPQGEAVEWMAPPTEGAYRLYVYVLDGEGHAATANLPLYVRPKE